MWALLAMVMALALFASLSIEHMHQSEQTAFHVAERSMESQSAEQMEDFASAAWGYFSAESISAGQKISVSSLISSGYLPNGFSSYNAFGQKLEALTGKTSLVAYYENQPTNLYGNPIDSETENAFSMAIVEKLSAMQENAPQYVAGVTYNGNSGRNYDQVLLPYSTTAITMSANDPQFSLDFPSVIDLVNVLPSAKIISASTTSATTQGTGNTNSNPIASLSPGKSYTDSAGNVFTAYNSSQGTVIYVPVSDGYLWMPQSVFSESDPSLSDFYVPSGTGTNDSGEGPYSLSVSGNEVYGYWNGGHQGTFPLSDFGG